MVRTRGSYVKKGLDVVLIGEAESVHTLHPMTRMTQMSRACCEGAEWRERMWKEGGRVVGDSRFSRSEVPNHR